MDAILASVGDYGLRRLIGYWAGKRGGGSVPFRREVDPVEIPWILPRLWIYERTSCRTFRNRLAGEEIVEAFGRSLRGRTLEEIFPAPTVDFVKTCMGRVVDGPCVVVTTGQSVISADRYRRAERVMLPLLDREGLPTLVLGATVYSTARTPLRDPPPSTTTVAPYPVDAIGALAGAVG